VKCTECGAEGIEAAEPCGACGAAPVGPQSAPVGQGSGGLHKRPAEVVPMTLVGVRVEQPSNTPIALLKEAQGDRYLPIWIGAVEATAIAFAQQGMVSLKPLTHDLFCDVLKRLGVQLLNVTVSALTDGVFESYLSLSGHGTVTCRPSDGIALAVRTGAPILASAEVLDDCGVAIPDDDVHLPGLLLQCGPGLEPRICIWRIT
jgi:uncharacterized protein